MRLALRARGCDFWASSYSMPQITSIRQDATGGTIDCKRQDASFILHNPFFQSWPCAGTGIQMNRCLASNRQQSPGHTLRVKNASVSEFEESSMHFADRVAVVTGASSGIGRALAKLLASQGAKVGLVARRQDALERVSEEIEQRGGHYALAAADVGNRQQIVAAIQRIAGQLGPIDLLIANAGVGMPTLLDPMNVSDIEATFRVNVLGVVYSVEAVLPEMLGRRRGHLAAVSSLAAYKGMPGESAYCASKAALNTYMEGLRIHLRDRGVHVTTVCPGFVRTEMTSANKFSMPFLLEAEEAAKRIARALYRRVKVYNFPWQSSMLMRLARWAPDWALARAMRQYNEDPPFVTSRGPPEVRQDS
jgi:short-subunit dehydrogenase